jgi:hypothetical protein
MGGNARKDFGSSAGTESAKYLGRDNGQMFPARSRRFEIVDQANAQLSHRSEIETDALNQEFYM